MKLNSQVWARKPVGRWYSNLAIHVCNALLLIILLNAILLPVYAIRDEQARNSPPGLYADLRQRIGPEWTSLVYPGLDDTAVTRLYAEWYHLVFEYDPFTQYRLQPVQGMYYNVTANDFRLNGHSVAWPPDSSAFNIFVFGGSTTFATGLPDYQTIPAALETILNERPCPQPVRVYNFGVPGHASLEERARFEQLLLNGTVPQVAVFIDGLNDAVGRIGNSSYTATLTRMMAMANTRDNGVALQLRFREFVAGLPMTRLAESVLERLGRFRRADDPTRPYVYEADLDDETRLVRWLANKRMAEAVGQQFGVTTLFVWQPVPIYNYEPSEHLLAGQVPRWMEWSRLFEGKRTLYDRMSERRHDPDIDRNFLWLADIQVSKPENLYVDQQHYTAPFSMDIARAIADDLSQRGWLACNDQGVRPVASSSEAPPRG